MPFSYTGAFLRKVYQSQKKRGHKESCCPKKILHFAKKKPLCSRPGIKTMNTLTPLLDQAKIGAQGSFIKRKIIPQVNYSLRWLCVLQNTLDLLLNVYYQHCRAALIEEVPAKIFNPSIRPTYPTYRTRKAWKVRK